MVAARPPPRAARAPPNGAPPSDSDDDGSDDDKPYDPLAPTDYAALSRSDALKSARKSDLEVALAAKRAREEEEREEMERRRRQVAEGGGASLNMGRGRKNNLPAWMTQKEQTKPDA